ncbi:MAG: hypothetical protein ACK5PP_12090 [Acidimicrobiales bacterium]
MNRLTAAYHAEWFRLTRPLTLRRSVVGAALYAVVVTAVLVGTAAETGSALTISSIEAADDATASLVLATSFSSVLVLCLIIPLAAGDIAGGTLRTGLLQNPNRLRVAGGFLAARLLGLGALVTIVTAVSWVTAAVVAMLNGLDIGAWFTADGLAATSGDFVRTLVYAACWAVFGTAVGVITRSVAVGLFIGVMWAGPVENVLGDDLALVQEWAPGLLLQDMLTGSDDFSTAHVTLTLAAYLAVALGTSGMLLMRRDVV